MIYTTNLKRWIGDIEKFEITFKEHSSSYDFFDSVTVVEDFLNAVKNEIPRYSAGVLIRAGYSKTFSRHLYRASYTDEILEY